METTRADRVTGADLDRAAPWLGPAVVTGVLLGIGIAGFIDESVFHQLLQWHTFYWATDQRGRILSDGLFHIGSTLILLWGAWRLWRDRASWTPSHSRAILGGILVGVGGFNTYDGVVQQQEEDRVMVTRDLRGSTGPRGRHRKEESMRLQSYAGTHGADELVIAHRARIRRMIGSHRVRRIQTRVVALEDEMCGGIQQKGA